MGNDSHYTVNASEVRTEGSFPTPVPLENVGLLLFRIIVGREDRC